MVNQRKLKELEFEFQNNDNETNIFVVREPTAEETNAADLIRSRAFFEAVDNGIRTETEILRRLKQQGRFNEDEHNLECTNLGIQLRDTMINMSISKNKDDLVKCHEDAREIRETLMERYRDKETFLQHSAEQKAENALNLALLGVCLEKKDGTPIFAVVKKDTQELDIEQTYNSIHNYEDTRFLTTCLSYFMPLVMGIDREALREHPEDVIFKEKLVKITGEDEVEIEIPVHKIKKVETVYSPNKENTSKSTAAPIRQKDNFEINVDVSKEKDETFETMIKVPDFNMDDSTVEVEPEVKEVENKKAPVAPVFKKTEVIVEKPTVIENPISSSDKEETIASLEDLENENIDNNSYSKKDEDVIKVGNDTGNIRPGKEDFVDRDGAARPFGAWTPPSK